MKKILIVLICIMSLSLFSGCKFVNDDVVRIHIRANSNLAIDQEVKLKVRDEVVKVITPLLADCKNSSDVKYVLNENLDVIENIADGVLFENGFQYLAKASLNNEYFPSREYDGEVFDAGYYDALILNLGTGNGDNWWCVAYPPLCFVGNVDGGSVRYESKLLELINKFFGE